jgi:hypothetical protein
MIWNSDLVETLEFENLLQQAVVTIRGPYRCQDWHGAHRLPSGAHLHAVERRRVRPAEGAD